MASAAAVGVLHRRRASSLNSAGSFSRDRSRQDFLRGNGKQQLNRDSRGPALVLIMANDARAARSSARNTNEMVFACNKPIFRPLEF
jgi:hypothetical protein